MNEAKKFMVGHIFGKKVWDDQLNPKTKRHLYFKDFCIENQIPTKFVPFAEKVWDDIHNNDTLTYDNFDDYYIDNFKPDDNDS